VQFHVPLLTFPITERVDPCRHRGNALCLKVDSAHNTWDVDRLWKMDQVDVLNMLAGTAVFVPPIFALPTVCL
jgi:hypothetical protein